MPLSTRRLDLDLVSRLSFGVGAVDGVGEFVRGCGGRRAFVVTDPGVRQAGVTERVRQRIAESMDSIVFEGVGSNPTTSDVEDGGSALRNFGLVKTVVVAVGGGSVMDAAKAISLQSTNGGSARELADPGRGLHPGLPVVAVPTTAGTGAETNGFGVITDPVEGRKFYVGHDSVRPRRCVLDAALTLGLPPLITAATGIDALTHALEALMSRNANPVADGLALQAIRMIAAWLPTAVSQGENVEARSQMLLASNVAGQAFATGTGLGLCHAIAHPLGARLGVPHGVAIAGALTAVMRFNLPVSEEKIALAASSLGVASASASSEANARAAIEAVENIVAEALWDYLPVSDAPPTSEMVDTIVEDALADPVINNTPRSPSAEQVGSIVSKMIRSSGEA